MIYFQNNDEAWMLGGLNIENGMDKVDIFGNMSVEPTLEGLEKISALIRQMEILRAALRERLAHENGANNVGESVEKSPKSERGDLGPEVVDNPF